MVSSGLAVGAKHRVLLEEPLVADHRRRRARPVRTGRVLEAHLPEGGVAGEERRVTTSGGERLDRVAHRRRPVLVVTDRQVQRVRRVGTEQLGMLLEIGVRNDVDRVVLPLGPLDERQTPVRPTGRAAVGRQVVHPQVADMARRLMIGRMQRRHALTRAGRLVQVARRHRPQHRRLGGAGVEVAAAEVVVGVPRVGVDRPEDACTRRGEVGTHDEEGTARALLPVGVDRQQHLVVARPPVQPHDDLGGGRPVAPVLGRVGRRRVIARRHTLFGEHDLAHLPDPGDLDRHRSTTGRRQVQCHRLARGRRLRPAVSVHRLVRHRRDPTRRVPAPVDPHAMSLRADRLRGNSSLRHTHPTR